MRILAVLASITAFAVATPVTADSLQALRQGSEYRALVNKYIGTTENAQLFNRLMKEANPKTRAYVIREARILSETWGDSPNGDVIPEYVIKKAQDAAPSLGAHTESQIYVVAFLLLFQLNVDGPSAYKIPCASDCMNEMSEMTSMRLEYQGDRRSKFVEALSNIMKKIDSTQETIVQNLK